MSTSQRFGSFSTFLPYDEVRMFIEPTSGEYGPLSVVIAEDAELGLRDEGSFMPDTGGVREGDQILMAGHLGVMGYEVEVPVIAAFDFRPNHMWSLLYETGWGVRNLQCVSLFLTDNIRKPR